MIEVERKYRVSESTAVEVKSRLVVDAPQESQTDFIFLQDADSFDSLDRTRSFAVIRIRETGNGATLTAKRRQSDSSSIEVELEATPSAARDFMELLEWNMVSRVTKVRVSGDINGVTVAVDDVECLGHFVELEIVTHDPMDVEGAEVKIALVAKSLGLTGDMIETRKYDEMMSDVAAPGEASSHKLKVGVEPL